VLVYIRHGSTALNSQTPGEEHLRGWLPIPLSPQGVKEGQDTGMRLARGLSGPPTTFRTSDLNRTQQMAAIVGKSLGVQATADSNIRDWNTGKLAGQKVSDALPTLKYLINNPNEPAPGGESMNDYRQRFEPLMRQLIAAPGVHVVVGHGRGASLLEGIADPEGGVGQAAPIKFLLERPKVKPGGILMINDRWGTSIDNPAEQKSDEG
jgi:broad specificity phosphatase PhoE